jgi:hypothetical protein
LEKIAKPKGIRKDYEKDVKEMNEEGKLCGVEFL